MLSTLHTNDAASTIVRLIDMGIEPYLVSSSVVGIIAQRLVKKICTNCKVEYYPTHTERQLLSLKDNDILYKELAAVYVEKLGIRAEPLFMKCLY